VRPLPFLWPYWIPFWIVYVWAFSPEFAIIRRAQTNINSGESKDRGSMGFIMVSMQIGMLIAFGLAFVPSLWMPLNERVICFWIGLGMLVLGSALRRYCWHLLGEFFTGDVNARPDQPVIQKGPYRWIRHPSYTGGIIMFAGISLALGTWLGVVIGTLSAVVAYAYRIRVEEKALVETIGEPYAEYMRRSKRLVPYVI
jgi:protein-S-isoprenylcysteine O-methyltransferase Ste14